MNFKAFLLAVMVLGIPTASDAGKGKYYRDLDGDGHYNKKSYDGGHHHGRYYGNHYGSYYGRPYGYGGYGYGGYGYRNSYWGGYGYPYYSYGPRIGVSFYSRPTYYSSRVYRGSVANGSLAADVQRALRSKGYYHGSVDGLIGSGSRAAIRSYQRDRGMAITGRIDRELLRSLRIG